LHWRRIIIAFYRLFCAKYRITCSICAMLTFQSHAIIIPYIPDFPAQTQEGKDYKAARIASPAATKLPAPAISWPAAPVGVAKAEEAADEPAPPAEVALLAADVAGLLEVVAAAEVLATVEVEATVEEGVEEAAVLDAEAVVETGAEDDAVPDEAAVELAPPPARTEAQSACAALKTPNSYVRSGSHANTGEDITQSLVSASG
jgi:hypothetical protein